MRRAFVGLLAILALVGPVVFAAPTRSDVPLGAPCGGVVPCGEPDERVQYIVDWVISTCPGLCQP